jgi:hypothetical protein
MGLSVFFRRPDGGGGERAHAEEGSLLDYALA